VSSHRTSGEIVVVDPCPTIRDALTVILEMEGYTVRAFARAEDFLPLAMTLEPVCVLLDMGFPSLSGLDVLKMIGGSDYRAPVIMLSGLGDPTSPQDALDAGARGFVEKPFNAEVLMKQIRGALADGGRQTSTNPDESPSRSVARPRT